jgi:diguanylate cyclase (GGDEF)-like protein
MSESEVRQFQDVTSLSQEVELLRATVAIMRARMAELEQLADTDSLTPLPNRRAFTRELNRAIMNAARHGETSAVIYLDINGLKAINDQHGHSAGDAMILHIGRELRSRVRVTDTVARIGGDEFAILLTHVSEFEAQTKAMTLTKALAQTSIDIGHATLPAGICCGVTAIAADDVFETVVARADAAMYASRAAASSGLLTPR